MTARRLGQAGLVLGFATVGGTLVGLFGRSSWVFDLIGNFRFQYLWLGVVAMAPVAWNHWWRSLAVIGAAAILNLAVVAPYWLGSVPDPVGDARLTIVHLNTLAANDDKPAVVEFIRAQTADIVFLAEVTPDLLALIEQADLPYERLAGTPEVTPIGLLALTRDPTASGRVTNLGETGVPGLVLEVVLGGRRVEILAFHTTSPGRAARSSARDDQLRGAAARVMERDAPMVLVGDFNATPWTGAFRDLLDAGLVDAQRGRGVAGTWPAGWGPFKIPIDHLLHTPELTTTSFAFGPSAGSDHRSLIATVAPATG
jgi:endonuclease/exonuclease/phosphatase (EEP) superfamily protein YafD